MATLYCSAAGRILVGICLALVLISIGLPQWGWIERGSEFTTKASFGLFQSRESESEPTGMKLHRSCVLAFEDFDESTLRKLQARYNIGRFLVMLSFIPILMLLRRTKSSKQLMTLSIGAASYFFVATVLMGTTIRDENTFGLIFSISKKCHSDITGSSESVKGTDSAQAGYYNDDIDDDIDDGPMKYSIGTSFGLYVVVLAALASLSGIAIYCEVSGNHMFGGEDASDLTYQLMSHPYAGGQSANMGPPAMGYMQQMPQQYAYLNSDGSVSGMQATISGA